MSVSLAVDVPTATKLHNVAQWLSRQPPSPRLFDQEENGFSQNFQPFMKQEKTMNSCTIPDDLHEEMMRLKRKENAFKTALCKTFQLTRTCSYGEQCKFAHSVNELKLKQKNRGVNHPKYKTVLCDNFSRTGHCKYGTKCQFIHRTVEPTPAQNPLLPQFSLWFAPQPGLAQASLSSSATDRTDFS